jgi:integrase
MRRGELAAVTWRSLDLDRARVVISRRPDPRRRELRLPKVARSLRAIGLDDETVGALRSHRDTQVLE